MTYFDSEELEDLETSANCVVETSDYYVSVLRHVAVQMRWKRM